MTLASLLVSKTFCLEALRLEKSAKVKVGRPGLVSFAALAAVHAVDSHKVANALDFQGSQAKAERLERELWELLVLQRCNAVAADSVVAAVAAVAAAVAAEAAFDFVHVERFERKHSEALLLRESTQNCFVTY